MAWHNIFYYKKLTLDERDYNSLSMFQKFCPYYLNHFFYFDIFYNFIKRYNKSNQIIIFQDNVESWVMFHCCIMCDDDQN